MFLLREVFTDDIAGLLAVAEHLDTVNLPHDRAVLERLIDHSRRSFSGELPVTEREYIFVLLDEGRVIGTSMIHAQHGTRRSPHIFLEVRPDERYSETLDRYFVHQVLRIGYNYNGPTEIGGLILLPEYRSHKIALGRSLSYLRFLYIALHRAWFRDEVLAELLPPLEPDGTSLLWETLGRHFTGMTYQEADHLSKTNKEFIRTLFPTDPIYTCMMPREVQALIGVVGPETRGVEKMLRRIGFHYANRIDPFDGGPHFIAKTDDITLVRESHRARVAAGALSEADEAGAPGLVCVERNGAGHPRFAATPARLHSQGGNAVLSDEACRALGVGPGDEVGILMF